MTPSYKTQGGQAVNDCQQNGQQQPVLEQHQHSATHSLQNAARVSWLVGPPAKACWGEKRGQHKEAKGSALYLPICQPPSATWTQSSPLPGHGSRPVTHQPYRMVDYVAVIYMNIKFTQTIATENVRNVQHQNTDLQNDHISHYNYWVTST